MKATLLDQEKMVRAHSSLTMAHTIMVNLKITLLPDTANTSGATAGAMKDHSRITKWKAMENTLGHKAKSIMENT